MPNYKMFLIAAIERRKDYKWGIVHPGNAMVHSIYDTKKKAIEANKTIATAYSVVPIIIQPDYMKIKYYRR